MQTQQVNFCHDYAQKRVNTLLVGPPQLVFCCGLLVCMGTCPKIVVGFNYWDKPVQKFTHPMWWSLRMMPIDLGKLERPHVATSLTNHGNWIRGNVPKIATSFRLVNYYNLPRLIPLIFSKIGIPFHHGSLIPILMAWLSHWRRHPEACKASAFTTLAVAAQGQVWDASCWNDCGTVVLLRLFFCWQFLWGVKMRVHTYTYT